MSEILSSLDALEIKSNVHLERYKKLMIYYHAQCIVKTKDKKGRIETHHILPKSIYPEVKREKWNKINLPAEAHYLAHYLLFKAINDSSMVFAFNQMRRITKSSKPNCRLYASVRFEIAKVISHANTGLRRDEKFCEEASNRMKGTNLYRSLDGILKRYQVGEEPDGWVSFQTNRKRTSDSKNKMSNIMSGRKWQYNENTKEVIFEREISDGFIEGFPPWFNSSGEGSANTIWIHHRITHKNKRIKVNQPLPEDYIIGRFFETNPGLEKLNNKEMKLVLDLIDKKYCYVSQTDLPNVRYLNGGVSVDKTYIYRYNNIVFTSILDLVDYLGITRLPPNPTLLKIRVSKPHFNQSERKRTFCEQHQGKTYEEIGVSVIALKDYSFNEREIYDSSRRCEKTCSR